MSRYGLDALAVDRMGRLLAALAAEPDPPTTAADPTSALRVHIADSLSGLDLEDVARTGAVADIGAGAGFPGLALAAARPSARVDLIDSVGRKCDVIERLAAAAELPSARAVRARVEDWGRGEGREAYGVATARALGPLPVVLEYAAPLLVIDGVLVVWKGARDADEERAGAEAARKLGMRPKEVRRVTPFEGARNRHLHVYAKVAPTPGGFPRRPGAARKRPLAG